MFVPMPAQPTKESMKYVIPDPDIKPHLKNLLQILNYLIILFSPFPFPSSSFLYSILQSVLEYYLPSLFLSCLVEIVKTSYMVKVGPYLITSSRLAAPLSIGSTPRPFIYPFHQRLGKGIRWLEQVVVGSTLTFILPASKGRSNACCLHSSIVDGQLVSPTKHTYPS